MGVTFPTIIRSDRSPVPQQACRCVKALRQPGGGCECIKLETPRRCKCTYCLGEVRRIQQQVREVTQ